MADSIPVWADMNHPSNALRPRTKCWGCGKMGCVGKHWGNWCFECNVRRMGRLDAQFKQIDAALSSAEVS